MVSQKTEPANGSMGRRKITYLRVAGCMIIIAGVLALVNGLQPILGNMGTGLDFGIDRYSGCGILIVIFGVVAIIGGISALKGKSVSLVLLGAVCGTIGDGVAGFFLGLGALVLIILSNEDL